MNCCLNFCWSLGGFFLCVEISKNKVLLYWFFVKSQIELEIFLFSIDENLFVYRDLPAEDDNGIEGILRRLEKHRNLSFGFKLGRNSTTSGYVNGKSGDNNQNERIRKDVGELTLFLIPFHFGLVVLLVLLYHV